MRACRVHGVSEEKECCRIQFSTVCRVCVFFFSLLFSLPKATSQTLFAHVSALLRMPLFPLHHSDAVAAFVRIGFVVVVAVVWTMNLRISM